MTRKDAEQILKAFELYAHDEYGETLVESMIPDFLDFGFPNEKLPESDIGNSFPDVMKCVLRECAHPFDDDCSGCHWMQHKKS